MGVSICSLTPPLPRRTEDEVDHSGSAAFYVDKNADPMSALKVTWQHGCSLACLLLFFACRCLRYALIACFFVSHVAEQDP